MSEQLILKSSEEYRLPNTSVPELIWKQLSQLSGDAVCCIEANSDRKLTVSELMSRSQSFANALLDKGLKKSDVILTFAENSLEHVVAMFGAVLTGATIYPVTYIATSYELAQLLPQFESLAIITTPTKSPLIENALKKSTKSNVKFVVILDGVYGDYHSFEAMISDGANRPLPSIPIFSVQPEKDVFLMIQSSGTSGVPKSIMHSHYSYVHCIYAMNYLAQFYPEQLIFGHITPFGCFSGTSFVYAYISAGIRVVIYHEFSVQSFLQSIEKYKINDLFIVPALGPLLLSPLADKYDLSSMKLMITGGSAFPGAVGKGLIDKYNIFFREGYGLSEFGAILFPYDDSPYIPGSLGKPILNTELKIRDIVTGHNLGPDMTGEVCLRGPSMFIGYYNERKATDEAIDSEGWLRTGDIGHYDKEGRIFITDRLKELIKFGTKQVSPTEIEMFLVTHPCVAEVAVVGVRHPYESQWPRAYVKLKDNMTATEEEIKKYVSDNLNDAKQLRAGVVFVEAIPRTTFGKVDRRYFKTLIENEIIVE